MKTGKRAQSGQIFSLDYALSLILVFLAIGIALNFFELQTVSAKEKQLRTELQNIGDASARLLLSSKDITCQLDSNSHAPIGFLSNCIKNNSSALTKQNLGIPAGFDCNLSITNFSYPAGFADGCSTSIPLAKDIYSAKRTIVIKSDQNVTKTELENCMNSSPGCPLADANASLSIWRR